MCIHPQPRLTLRQPDLELKLMWETVGTSRNKTTPPGLGVTYDEADPHNFMDENMFFNRKDKRKITVYRRQINLKLWSMCCPSKVIVH